jgi:hypothetical protein
MLPGHTRASLLGEAEVMLKITVVEDGKRVFPSSGKESTNRPSAIRLHLANTLRGFAFVNESAAKMDASKTLWQEARELYANCNVEAGVAECNKKLSQ